MFLKQEKSEMNDFEEQNFGSKGKILKFSLILLFQNILSIFVYFEKKIGGGADASAENASFFFFLRFCRLILFHLV